MQDERQRAPWRQRGGGPRRNFQTTQTVPRKRPAEDAQEAAWVAGEDRFVLQQAKKKAAIRVKEGRAKPIDWLAVTLRFIDSQRGVWDDEIDDADLDVVDPEGVVESLNGEDLEQLSNDIQHYLTLETNQTSKEFWETMDIICSERIAKARGGGRDGLRFVEDDVDNMLSGKNLEQLLTLEKAISKKLSSNEPIDYEYWEGVRKRLQSWKAKARLRQVSRKIVDSQVEGLKKQEASKAETLRTRMAAILVQDEVPTSSRLNTAALDPEPLLKLPTEDKSLKIIDEKDFLQDTATERLKVLKMGYVPAQKNRALADREKPKPKTLSARNDDFSQATADLYEREVARGVAENEEVFAAEEEVSTDAPPKWADKYRPRKPRYFNRVQMGYEWNKYNQTHYDHDNPPPKVVQGYKFNVFYPDLIDKSKAPTYKIQREGGRKRGQSFAPAGEDDTCVIRFLAGPPYEDVAFRIVDKEWDFSAKRERGFKSTFDKGILQLHFQFKKVFYRK